MAKRICIITDSTGDLPADIAQEYQINIVPTYVRFGEHVYRDGVDLTPGQFYEKLRDSNIIPSTSQPSPEDFFKVFSEAADNSAGIVSIHISSKISGTYNSALLAKHLLPTQFPIEVIDSRFNSAGLALTVLTAAKSAMEGKDIRAIIRESLKAISEIKMFGMFSTTKYLARSGRVNKAIAVAGNFLNVKPLMTFRDGEIIRAVTNEVPFMESMNCRGNWVSLHGTGGQMFRLKNAWLRMSCQAIMPRASPKYGTAESS